MAAFTVSGLRVVTEVARTGSFSAAAERLGYTQSAVSRQVALMERAAGAPLFTRHPRGVSATDAGELLLRRAARVLAELDAAAADLREADRTPAVRLGLGAVSSAMAALVPTAVRAFARREPAVRVRLREGLGASLLRAVATERIDVAVVPEPPKLVAGVSLRPLLDDRLYVLVAADHPLAREPAVTAAQLASASWVAGSSDPGSSLLGAWSDGDRPPAVTHVARDWVAKIGLVAAGAGVTVAPGLLVPALPTTVRAVAIEHPRARRPTVLAVNVARERSGPHELRGLVDALTTAAARPAPG